MAEQKKKIDRLTQYEYTVLAYSLIDRGCTAFTHEEILEYLELKSKIKKENKR